MKYFSQTSYFTNKMSVAKEGAVHEIPLYQRCQLLRITRSHCGKLQKFSVFYELRKTVIFLREFFKKVVIRNVAKKALKKRV